MSAVQQQHNAAAETIFGIINGTHQFHGHTLHSLVVGEVIWFRAKDVTQILGYKDTVNAILQHVHSKNTSTLRVLLEAWCDATPSNFTYNELQSKYVNEPGMYALIFRSRLPLAQEFQQYVWDEILPEIRKRTQAPILEQVERLQIENASLQRRELALRSYVHNTSDIPKTQVLYIATTQAYAAQNRFKFGGVRELHDLRRRLGEYNVGRPEGDLYFYVQIYRCNSYKSTEERLHILFAHFKDKEDSRKEMVRMNLARLCDAVAYVVSNFGGEVDYMNERCEAILRDTVYDEPIPVSPLDLDAFNSTTAATVRVDVSGWSSEEFSTLFEDLIEAYAESQGTDYTCTEDGPAQLELPWGALSEQLKKSTKGLTLMQWRDKFRQWYAQRRPARLQLRGLKLTLSPFTIKQYERRR